MRFELFTFQTELDAPIDAVSQRHAQRDHLLLRVTHEGVVGFGEVSPQPHRLNGDPSLDEVVAQLTDVLLPSFVAAVSREGDVPHWSRVTRFQGSGAGANFAAAILEMAVLDWQLQRDGEALQSLWPSVHPPAIMRTVDVAWRGSLSEDVARLRVKVGAVALNASFIDHLSACQVPVILDYNCAGPSTDEIRGLLRQLDGLVDVVAVEQPFAAGNVVEHALLAKELPVPLSLDEGVRSRRDVEHIAQYGAASMVCLKPARLGGYSVTRAVAARALELGLRPYIGGFFESPLARTVNRQVAAATVSEPSDVGVVERRGESGLWRTTAFGVGVAPERALEGILRPVPQGSFEV